MADVSHPSSLNLEPNPFEQSFASNTQQGHSSGAPSNGTPVGAREQPAAIQHEPNKHADSQFGAGTHRLDQKTPIPGIDKMLTPLPLVPGAPPFGPTGPLTSQMGIFGTNSPAGWLPPRFGPITPGALNTPSLDAFGAHNAANVQPHGFPHLPPGVHLPQIPANGTGADVYGRPSQSVLPMGSPGINSLVGMNTPGMTSNVPAVHGVPNVPHVPQQNGSSGPNGTPLVPKPQGENAAANGLYMLSQNQLTEKAQSTPLGTTEKPQETEHFSLSPEAKRRESQQQKQQQQEQQERQDQPQPASQQPEQPQEPQEPHSRSVDSTGSGSVDKSLAKTGSSSAPHSRHNSTSKKRTSKEVDDDEDLGKSDAGAEDEHGDKRRWTNSQHSSDAENEEKRKQFLERNRIAAIKCRARKKQWVDNLQQKVDMYARANDELAHKSEKMRLDFDELRQFILRYHDIGSLPQHILHIVQGTADTAGAGAMAASAVGHDFGGMPSHILPGTIPGAMPGHAPLQPTMTPSVSSGPQSMASSIIPSPAPQRAAPNNATDPRYQPHAQAHAQSPQSHYVSARQQPPIQQQPPMQHIHQASQ